MSGEILRCPEDTAFRFTGEIIPSGSFLDMGSVLVMISVISIVISFVFQWILDAEAIGKTTDEKEEISVIRNRIRTISALSFLILIVGGLMYVYNRLRG